MIKIVKKEEQWNLKLQHRSSIKKKKKVPDSCAQKAISENWNSNLNLLNNNKKKSFQKSKQFTSIHQIVQLS